MFKRRGIKFYYNTIKGHKFETYRGSNFVELLSVKIFAWLDKLSNGILHLYFICAFTLIDIGALSSIIIGKGINTIKQASNNKKL